jgi:DNA-directed RNA polymerase subunit alpha
MRVRWKDFELPTRVMIHDASLTGEYGLFVAEPFERGYGVTIGNCLRRVLLSSIEGAAVTHIRIKGAQHEFASLAGVVEDVTAIVLNLKQLAVRIDEDGVRRLRLETHAKGEVTAGQFTPDPAVEILNPKLHIATLNDDTDLEIEVEIRRGRGYMTAEEHGRDGQELGVIPVDSSFSPVRRVKYRVENTRVGKRTNFDRLLLEVWTNGAVTPELAVVEASKILRRHLNPFVQYFELGKELQINEKKEEAARQKEKFLDQLRQKLAMSITELDLSVRATNCLMSEKVETLRELVQRQESELLKIRNFGKTSLKEVKKKLSDINLSLGMNLDELFGGKEPPASGATG